MTSAAVANLIRDALYAGVRFEQRDGGWALVAGDDTPPALLERLRQNRDEIISILSAGSSLKAARGELYRCSGIVWPEDEASAPVGFSALLRRVSDAGIKFSLNGARLIRWSHERVPNEFIRQIASHGDAIRVAIGDWDIDEPNHDLPQFDPGETDHHCACGLMATYAVYDAHQPDNQRWLCDVCFNKHAPHPPAPSRQKTSYRQKSQTESPRKPPQIIERPDETARLTWWSEPVQGWGEGWFVIHNMASNQTVKIDIKEEKQK